MKKTSKFAHSKALSKAMNRECKDITTQRLFDQKRPILVFPGTNPKLALIKDEVTQEANLITKTQVFQIL